MLGNIGPLEIVVVLIIALVVFGPKRLPELGSSLGRGIREFRETVSGDKPDDSVREIDRPKATAPAEEPAKSEAASDKQT
jgi:sec-independent protein translocase protein TatA